MIVLIFSQTISTFSSLAKLTSTKENVYLQQHSGSYQSALVESVAPKISNCVRMME